MPSILQVNASLFSGEGQSFKLTEQFVKKFQEQNPETTVTNRDLAASPIPHLDATMFQGFMLPAEQRNEKQTLATRLSDQLIQEIHDADILVIGLPMYNYSIPSTMKSWFDHIARAGITFRYTANGPEGLLKGKKAYILAARGGMYQGTPFDTQTDFIRHFLGFIGIDDVQFIYAEGLAMGDESRDQALTDAAKTIEQLVA